jgi:hypothetical protein
MRSLSEGRFPCDPDLVLVQLGMLLRTSWIVNAPCQPCQFCSPNDGVSGPESTDNTVGSLCILHPLKGPLRAPPDNQDVFLRLRVGHVSNPHVPILRFLPLGSQRLQELDVFARQEVFAVLCGVAVFQFRRPAYSRKPLEMGNLRQMLHLRGHSQEILLVVPARDGTVSCTASALAAISG